MLNGTDGKDHRARVLLGAPQRCRAQARGARALMLTPRTVHTRTWTGERGLHREYV